MAGWALVRPNAPKNLGARILAPFSSSIEMSMLEICLGDAALDVRSEAVEVVAHLLSWFFGLAFFSYPLSTMVSKN